MSPEQESSSSESPRSLCSKLTGRRHVRRGYLRTLWYPVPCHSRHGNVSFRIETAKHEKPIVVWGGAGLQSARMKSE